MVSAHHQPGADPTGRAALIARAQLALAAGAIGAVTIFLGVSIVNDLAGEGTVRVPMEVMIVPGLVALLVALKCRDVVREDQGLRWKVYATADLSIIAGVITMIFRPNPFWLLCAGIGLAASVLTYRRNTP